MNSNLLSWLIVITLFTLVLMIMYGVWMLAVENGYDKGYKKGYQRGVFDARSYKSHREHQLRDDNDYLMAKVVDLRERINNK